MDPCGTPDEIFSQLKQFPSKQPSAFDLISSHYTRSTAALIFQSYISIDLKTIIQIFIPHIVGKDQLGYTGMP